MDRQLIALAAAHGVATAYTDWRGRRVRVRPEIVIEVLRLLGVEAGDPAAAREALAAARAAADGAALPGTVILVAGRTRPLPAAGVVTLEDGGRRDVGRELPADLPLGWHRLACAGRDLPLVVVPRRLPAPPASWGWMLQLYALHSARSWGMGDLGDLAEFTRWAGAGTGAGLVLLNPLHAVAPSHPVPASPYSPSSRRFANPLYLRVADTAAYRAADPELRARVDALRPPAPAAAGEAGGAGPGEAGAVGSGGADASADLIDYDAVWRAKRAALELLFPLADPVDLDADPELAAFATYCALAERHGSDWRTWPEPLRRPDGPAVAEARGRLAERIAFHAWIQTLCREQLAAAGHAARETGMPVGIVHDLAVGVDPGGADGWLLADVLAAGVHIGAPPDDFNQLGQDWGLAAWRPDRLAATGYAAYRDLLRRVLSDAGGLRVDHVAGLWRLWWIPPGAGPGEGTYVRYDPEAMLGILALEAYRAGAVVVGEDLGTVQPAVTRGLRGRNMLGSTVLWFARDAEVAGAPFLPPERWPRTALGTISTHDLPTAAGFLAGEHVRVRAELHQLAGSVADEWERAREDRRRLVAMLRDAGLLPPGEPSDDDVVVAMHAALAASPTRLLAVSLYDVLGEVRQPNLPGTVDEYPNWRMPLPATLERIRVDPRPRRIAELFTRGRSRR
ncbi:4-alpha-glucanotransferase [Plantactinospora sp. KBS50]|uniref:4-alpha-glucanotransferase n=1 Tax=Plantactinospora sp. KBS50 TaxID=2024580 RepID=UPI000BAABB85|nr:4-alpha-glucanotransferase [Plantactinospora sp. KBS50]